jgi:hypothetical protein
VKGLSIHIQGMIALATIKFGNETLALLGLEISYICCLGVMT